jgi:hypothetical protein
MIIMSACTGVPGSAESALEELNTAIREAAIYISQRVPKEIVLQLLI